MEAKKFLDTELDFRLVHYIEKRAGHGDTHEDIRKDLMRGGRSASTVDKYLKYVDEHKSRINLHSIYWQLAFFAVGLFLFLLIGAAVYYYL